MPVDFIKADRVVWWRMSGQCVSIDLVDCKHRFEVGKVDGFI